MGLVRSLRGTPNHKVARELLKELRAERTFRKRIQKLRECVSDLLFGAARQRDLTLWERR